MFGYGQDICNEELLIRDQVPKAEANRTALSVTLKGTDFDRMQNSNDFRVMSDRDSFIIYQCTP